MNAAKKKFLSDVAMSLKGCLNCEEGIWWSGWKREHWPAKLLRKGLRFYGFDRRTLFGLIEVTSGGSFTYRTLNEYSRKVKQVAGYSPDENDPHWKKLPSPKKGQFCTGYAIQWRRIKKANIAWPWPVRFPQLGWAHLPSHWRSPTIDADQSYIEGDKKYRRHLQIERNAKLRAQARDYWRTKLNGLHCLACSFSFEKRYGNWGANFIEMHHVVPLASLVKAREINVKKLVPLCANCHRMVHLRPKEPLSMADLGSMLATRSRKRTNAAHKGRGVLEK
jgi:predicted HNH restriction endonuclease